MSTDLNEEDKINNKKMHNSALNFLQNNDGGYSKILEEDTVNNIRFWQENFYSFSFLKKSDKLKNFHFAKNVMIENLNSLPIEFYEEKNFNLGTYYYYIKLAELLDYQVKKDKLKKIQKYTKANLKTIFSSQSILKDTSNINVTLESIIFSSYILGEENVDIKEKNLLLEYFQKQFKQLNFNNLSIDDMAIIDTYIQAMNNFGLNDELYIQKYKAYYQKYLNNIIGIENISIFEITYLINYFNFISISDYNQVLIQLLDEYFNDNGYTIFPGDTTQELIADYTVLETYSLLNLELDPLKVNSITKYVLKKRDYRGLFNFTESTSSIEETYFAYIWSKTLKTPIDIRNFTREKLKGFATIDSLSEELYLLNLANELDLDIENYLDVKKFIKKLLRQDYHYYALNELSLIFETAYTYNYSFSKIEITKYKKYKKEIIENSKKIKKNLKQFSIINTFIFYKLDYLIGEPVKKETVKHSFNKINLLENNNELLYTLKWIVPVLQTYNVSPDTLTQQEKNEIKNLTLKNKNGELYKYSNSFSISFESTLAIKQILSFFKIT